MDRQRKACRSEGNGRLWKVCNKEQWQGAITNLGNPNVARSRFCQDRAPTRQVVPE